MIRQAKLSAPNLSSHCAALLIFFAVLLFRAILVWAVNIGHAENLQNAELGQIAANIAAGRGFSSPLENGSTPTAWFGPIVPYAWALIFKIFGIGTERSNLVLHILQLVLGGLCGVAYWHIAKRLWQQDGRDGNAIPFAIALVAALWPVGIPRFTLLWYFVWEDLLIALLLLISLAWWRNPSWKSAVLLGVVGGLGGLVNIGPLTVLGGILGLKVISEKNWFRRDAWRCVAVMLIALVILAPWVIRNRVVLGAWIPGRSVTGIALLVGNNADGDIVMNVRTRHPAMDPVERRKFDRIGEIEYNRRASAEAVSYMVGHKLLTLKRCLLRFYVFWFTDLFDSWPWQPGSTWWERGGVGAAWRISQGLLNLASVFLLLWGLFRKPIPGFPIFLAFFIFVPLPYYLSISGWGYGHIVRPFVVLYGLMALAAWSQQKSLRAIS